MVEVVAGCTLVKRAVTFKEADESVDETKVEGYVQVTFIYTECSLYLVLVYSAKALTLYNAHATVLLKVALMH